MSTKAINQAWRLYLTSVISFTAGVALTALSMGFAVGASLPEQCRNALTTFIAQQ